MSIQTFYTSSTLPFPTSLPTLSRMSEKEFLPALGVLDQIWCTHLDTAEFIASGFRGMRPQTAKKVIKFLTSGLAKKVWHQTASQAEEKKFFDELDLLLT